MGLTASCASWAFFDFDLKTLLSKYFLPKVSETKKDISAVAFFESAGESVLM